MMSPRMSSLNHRARTILAAIIEEFIATGEPVSSRSVAKRAGLELSPATVRTVMAELEESGLLAQPHTSAGRVPTEEGLRYFVTSLMRPQEPAAEDLALLRAECDRAGDPEELMRTAVRTLSLLGQAAGLVTSPRIESVPLSTLRFIPVRPGTLLAVMVTKAGIVHERAIHSTREVDAAELERVHNYLNELIAGRSLVELRDVLQREIADAATRMDRMRQEALALGQQALEIPDGAAALVVEGQEHLLGRSDFEDAGMLRTAVRALADRSRLLELLEGTLSADGLHVVIGSPSGIESLAGLTLISARYGEASQPSGRLGLLGPSRMDYARAVALVTHTAKLVSVLLDQSRQ